MCMIHFVICFISMMIPSFQRSQLATCTHYRSIYEILLCLRYRCRLIPFGYVVLGTRAVLDACVNISLTIESYHHQSRLTGALYVAYYYVYQLVVGTRTSLTCRKCFFVWAYGLEYRINKCMCVCVCVFNKDRQANNRNVPWVCTVECPGMHCTAPRLLVVELAKTSSIKFSPTDRTTLFKQ